MARAANADIDVGGDRTRSAIKGRVGRVLLVSPPWRLVNWPSLSVGVLKAYLTKLGIATDGLHLHFDVAMRIGLARYQRIASGWELGEALYFSLYLPEEAQAILSRTAKHLEHKEPTEAEQLATLEFMAEVERATLDVLDAVDLSRYSVVGLSVGALQLGASLYLAKVLKQREPRLHVVLGGGSVLGEPGATLLRLVPWIDVVVDGEGENALAALASESEWDEELFKRVPNLRYRRSDGSIARSETRVMATLDDAPPPDMDEFYLAAQTIGYPRSNLVMPIEASRGCAWEHRKADGQLRGCTFCGLYRNSPNFREKRVEMVLAEMQDGVARSQAAEISFVDAYLPPSYAKDLLRGIASAGMDVTLFCEMRCDLDEEITDLLARAGTRQLQLGVEAFHTSILARMAKGTRTIDNVSSIKLCEEYGIPYQYNLILRFPGVSANEVKAMIQLLPLLRGFTPPTLADFYLDRGSRIHADPQRYGILPDTLDSHPLPFLPAAMQAVGISQFVPFEVEEDNEANEAWASLESVVEQWRTRYDEAREQGIDHLLSYRNLGESLLVSDYRGDESVILELNGATRDVLLASDRLIRKRELQRRLPEIDAETLDLVLEELRAHRLILEEGGLLLGLPVRSRLPNGAPRVWSSNA